MSAFGPLGFIYSYNVHDEHSFKQNLFFVLPLLFTVSVISLLRMQPMPQQMFASIIGCILGIIFYKVYEEIQFGLLDPTTLLSIYCPLFIARLVYPIEIRTFLKSFWQIIVSTLLDVVILSFIGFLAVVMSGSDVTILNIIACGALFMPCDVPMVLLELEGVKNLENLLQGEAILTTALGTMIHTICLWYFKKTLAPDNIIVMGYILPMILPILLGFVFGYLVSLIFKHLYDDGISATITVLISSYATYLACYKLLKYNGAIASAITIFLIASQRQTLIRSVDFEIRHFLTTSLNAAQIMLSITLSCFVTVQIVNHNTSFSVFISISIYLMGKAFRLLKHMMMIPIMQRFHYGFNISSAVALFWGTSRGPVILIQVLTLGHLGALDVMGHIYYTHALVYFLLTHLINITTLKMILRKFDIIKFTVNRENNISNAIEYIQNKQMAMISILKMNRLFCDANWLIINDATKIVNPYHKDDENPTENPFFFGTRQIKCPSCLRQVSVEPTPNELKFMARNMRSRLLKTERVAFIKLHENGFLTKDELNTLILSVEQALNTEDHFINIDHLFKIFKLQHFAEKFESTLMRWQILTTSKTPERGIKRICYIIMNHVIFDLSFYVLTLAQLILGVVSLSAYPMSVVSTWIYYTFDCIYFLYCVEFVIKWLGFSHESLRAGFLEYIRMGLEYIDRPKTTYWYVGELIGYHYYKELYGLFPSKNFWNMVDFIALLMNMLDNTILGISIIYGPTVIPETLVIICKFSREVRVFNLFKACGQMYPKIVAFYEKRRDQKAAFAFAIGTAIVVGYDEVIEKLAVVADNADIREVAKKRLEDDRLKTCMYLRVLEREKPWVTVKVKTKQAMMCTLIWVRNSIDVLKNEGFLDQTDFVQLNNAIENRFERILGFRNIEPLPPKTIFTEVPWLYGDTEIIKYLYENVTTKIWKEGDLICEVGKVADGIYIIVTGIFKLMYVPSPEYLKNWAQNGILPVKDYLVNTRFHEEQYEYLTKGNSIGEMSVLTGRQYSCNITAYTPCQAFIIPSNILWNAIDNSQEDSINSLKARLWKFVGLNLGKRILLDTPAYYNVSGETLNDLMDRAIFPSFDEYKILVLGDLVEDVVLIDGVVVDANTREIFTAPCYLARNVQKAIQPKDSNVNIGTQNIPKLMIIPLRHVDENDLMMKIDSMSEMTTSRLSNFAKVQKRRKRPNLMTKKRYTSQALQSLSDKANMSIFLTHTSSCGQKQD